MKKKVLIIVSIILVLIIGIGVFFYLNKDSENSDALRFSEEYGLTKDNVFVYREKDEILNIMKNGTGVVYLGFPECPWCKAYVVYLNEVAKSNGLDKIYYYNILEDRKNNTEFYQEVVSLLSGSLQYDEEGNERIYVPNVSFHVKGSIIGNDYETSKDTNGFSNPQEYWTETEINDLKDTLNEYFKKVVNELNTCTTCNK